MQDSHRLAYFEGVADGCAFGWARNQRGKPIPVDVRVNNALAATTAIRGWLRRSSGTTSSDGRFAIHLHLKPGDSVEVFDRLTGRALPGGVRTVVDPRWRPRIALVAPVKQEAPYLLEWIAYHRALGIETFVIGDNGGTDATSALLEALHEEEVIEWLDWRGAEAFQIRFYDDVVPRLRGRVDVCSLTDADEFIRPLNGRSDIQTAIAEVFARQQTSALGLNWATYGSSGRVKPDIGLVMERFTCRADDDHRQHRIVKTILRPECYAGMINTHVAKITNGDYVNDRGDPICWSDVPAGVTNSSWNSLRLDHFVVKSRSEFEAKARRGRPDVLEGSKTRDDAFFTSRDRNEIVDPMPAEFVERTKIEMAQLVDLISKRRPACEIVSEIIEQAKVNLRQLIE